MTTTHTFAPAHQNSNDAPKIERRPAAKNGRGLAQTFSPLIICLGAIALMPVCIPNLWELFSGLPAFAIIGFSAGALFILAALVCTLFQRARRGGTSWHSSVKSASR